VGRTGEPEVSAAANVIWAISFPSLTYSISPLEKLFHTEIPVRLPDDGVPETCEAKPDTLESSKSNDARRSPLGHEIVKILRKRWIFFHGLPDCL